MQLTFTNLVFALVFSTLVSLVAAMLTINKLRSADPADLYDGTPTDETTIERTVGLAEPD